MLELAWIIGATVFVSLLGLVGAFSFYIREDELHRIIFMLTAFAVGTLLGGSFLHLLPEALAKLDAITTMLFTLAGFVVFLVIEVYFHWHLSGGEGEVHPYSYLLLIGDAMHNFIDGLVIAGSFLVSIPFGIVTMLIIIAHELPEELGIFAVLVHGGFDRKKAVLSSFAVQCTALIGGIAGFYLSSVVGSFSSLLLPFAAGGFIYIAGSGLIPELHKEDVSKKFVSLALILLGLVFMWLVRYLGA